jgi:hypothetical protein
MAIKIWELKIGVDMGFAETQVIFGDLIHVTGCSN